MLDIESKIIAYHEKANDYRLCLTREEINEIKQTLNKLEHIRADAIEECINIVLDLLSKFIDYFDYVPLALLHKRLEQLKEQK